MSIINDYIIQSVHSTREIPPNPEATAILESYVQAAAGSKQAVPTLPDLALGISNKIYKLEPNVLGWSDMMFRFEPRSEEAILIMSDSSDLKMGLDNRYRLTESPNIRPIGLRGHWLDPATFYLDYIIFGDFIRSGASINFTGNRMIVTITYLNWNSPPIVLRGRMQER